MTIAIIILYLIFGTLNYVGLPILYPDINFNKRIKNTFGSMYCLPSGLIFLIISLIKIKKGKDITKIVDNVKTHNLIQYIVSTIIYILIFIICQK